MTARGNGIRAKRRRGAEYVQAAVLRMDPDRKEEMIILVGCGGTGGWLAPSLARIAYVQQKAGRKLKLVFMDPDPVEEANIGRQNFCAAEIGRNKAEALAMRYGAAWGVDIEFVPKPLAGVATIAEYYEPRREIVMVGCVDNARARRKMAEIVNNRYVWWLDCGNGKDNGQVLLGDTTRKEDLNKAFPSKKICVHLPAPHLQEPSLLLPQPGEEGTRRLSCAELARINAQSLAVNQRTAAEAADMLVRLLITSDLKRYAVYFDLASGTAVSKYVTPESVQAAVKHSGRKK